MRYEEEKKKEGWELSRSPCVEPRPSLLLPR